MFLMFYPEDFKKRLKKAYPDWEELHWRLDNNDYMVGHLLKENMQSAISIDSVLAAKSLEDLQSMAKAMEQRVKLYDEWCELYLCRYQESS